MRRLPYFIFTTLFFSAFLLKGTHIRGGYISVERTGGTDLTYEITFIGYRDTDSGIAFGNGVMDFGDGGTASENFTIVETFVSENVIIAEFKLIHTYSAPGAYTISYQEEFRNANVANMEGSVNTTFYVETTILADPLIGSATSGRLASLPIMHAETGKTLYYAPQVSEPDQERIAYGLTFPMEANNQLIGAYVSPNHDRFYSNRNQGNQAGSGPASLTMNRQTGTMIWDAPGDLFFASGFDCTAGYSSCSEYTLAFFFEEFRTVAGEEVRTSRTLVDFQIIVNGPGPESPVIPKLQMDYQPCITVDETVPFSLVAPGKHAFTLTANVDLFVNGATYEPADYFELSDSDDYEISFANLANPATLYLEVFPYALDEHSSGRVVHGDVPDLTGKTSSVAITIADTCPELTLDVAENISTRLLYPNPAQGEIVLPASHYQHYHIYDLKGKVWQNGKPQGETINIHQLHSGMYILRLNDQQGITEYFRFVKQN